MVEIRAGDLAFEQQEVNELFHRSLNLPLEQDQIAILHDRTEGWAAGLQLAALALHGRSPEAVMQSFGGSHRFMLDYLAAEVLEITGSRDLIARAAGANLFLVPLDEANNWFRYHHLLAEILKPEVSPDQRRAISLRAARWWMAQGQPAAVPSQVLVESLTAREMDVLRLVAVGRSNSEIADHLYLTTGTVKWFLNQIYGKLEVNRRTEAVAKARTVGLL